MKHTTKLKNLDRQCDDCPIITYCSPATDKKPLCAEKKIGNITCAEFEAVLNIAKKRRIVR